MRIKELIDKLNDLYNMHGDLEVVMEEIEIFGIEWISDDPDLGEVIVLTGDN